MKSILIKQLIFIHVLLLASCGMTPVQSQVVTNFQKNNPPYVYESGNNQLAETKVGIFKLVVDPRLKVESPELALKIENIIPAFQQHINNNITLNKLDNIELDFSKKEFYQYDRSDISGVLNAYDVPSVHFGVPAHIINMEFTSHLNDDIRTSVLTTLKGSDNWKKEYRNLVINEQLQSVILISIGLTQMQPRSIKKGIFAEKTILLGLNNIENVPHWLGNTENIEDSINVLSFKYLKLNSAGEILSAGIEGFHTFIPDNELFGYDITVFGIEDSSNRSEKLDDESALVNPTSIQALDNILKLIK
ncbi:MAG: hypothetical protein HRU38_22350 [Saccharospirillaceae bacterium]|nr:hypothetical protein [Pseudomonadales bacterium]NRB81369.1 hypothetical protein [Saccharospirillaceae bacterium]